MHAGNYFVALVWFEILRDAWSCTIELPVLQKRVLGVMYVKQQISRIILCMRINQRLSLRDRLLLDLTWSSLPSSTLREILVSVMMDVPFSTFCTYLAEADDVNHLYGYMRLYTGLQDFKIVDCAKFRKTFQNCVDLSVLCDGPVRYLC